MPFNLKTDFESFPNQIKERFTCAELFIGQIPIDRCAYIRKTVSCSDGHGLNILPECKNRNVLSGMIRPREARIAAMVSRYDNKISVLHCSEQLRKSAVEILQRSRITLNIVSVPVQHVEINKVCKYKVPPAFFQKTQR